MKPQPNHHKGIILATQPHMQRELPLTPSQQAALEGASQESGFTWRIRTVPRKNTAEASRKEWIRLIVAAAKTNRR